MPKTAAELAKEICGWLEQFPDMSGEYTEKKDGSVDINITYEGEEFYIQNYADPGMNIKQVGTVALHRPENIFSVNRLGVLTKEDTIAIWANGDV